MRQRAALSALALIALAAGLAAAAPVLPRGRGPGPHPGASPEPFADTTCCDLAPGESHAFGGLTITVLALSPDPTGGHGAGIARIRLNADGVMAERSASERSSLNWHGYHVAIASVQGSGTGRVALRVVPVASLPQCAGKHWSDPATAPWPCTERPG